MRVAPIGLYLIHRNYSFETIEKIGAETAALTHGHELGYLSAAMLTHIIAKLSKEKECSVLDSIKSAEKTMVEVFKKAEHIQELIAIIEKAIDLSQTNNAEDLDAINQIGGGWVAEEALAIAIYCAIKYENDFEKGVIAAVNHGGDSDSTGAIVGNILGTKLGINGIPHKYIENLELKDIIIELADDLYHDCQMFEYGSFRDEIWVQKYIDHTYSG